MKSKATLAVMMLAMSCIAALAFISHPKSTQETQVKFPPGKWTLQHPVISLLGLEDAPLKINSVTGDVRQGGTITSVRLKNDSGKAIAAVKFSWYLFRKQAPQNILLKGESPAISVKDFSDRAIKDVDYPVVSFGNVYKPLVKQGKLTGDFVLEVAVSAIAYEDGSQWERK